MFAPEREPGVRSLENPAERGVRRGEHPSPLHPGTAVGGLPGEEKSPQRNWGQGGPRVALLHPFLAKALLLAFWAEGGLGGGCVHTPPFPG